LESPGKQLSSGQPVQLMTNLLSWPLSSDKQLRSEGSSARRSEVFDAWPVCVLLGHVIWA